MKLRTYRECGEKGNIFFFFPVLSDSVAMGIVDWKAKKMPKFIRITYLFWVITTKESGVGEKVKRRRGSEREKRWEAASTPVAVKKTAEKPQQLTTYA